MKRALTGGIGIAAALTAAAFGVQDINNSTGDTANVLSRASLHDERREPPIPINADAFLDPARFRLSRHAPPHELSGTPIAGVVNHHVLASDLLARFFSTLRAARPDLQRIIILSPDHYRHGTASISVGVESYASRGAILPADREAAERLISAHVAFPGTRTLSVSEHGIGALIPFLAEQFPDIQVVPIAIRADVNRDDAENLGLALAQLIDENTFIIVSSDMSHYLSESEAGAHDRETLSWLEQDNAAAFRSAGDDHTDNGPAFVALYALFDVKAARPTFQLLDHSISSRYGGRKDFTTSYINGFWTKK